MFYVCVISIMLNDVTDFAIIMKIVPSKTIYDILGGKTWPGLSWNSPNAN